jgi:hypothetical protein
MSTKARTHLFSAVFCALLIALNWYRFVHFSRKLGVLSDGVGPFIIAYLLSGAVVLFLAFSCIRICRFTLRAGTKWITDWIPFLYALPLLYRTQAITTWTEPDGAAATQVTGYGSFPTLFWLAVAALALFQARSVALQIRNGSNQLPDPTSPSVTPPAGAGAAPSVAADH